MMRRQLVARTLLRMALVVAAFNGTLASSRSATAARDRDAPTRIAVLGSAEAEVTAQLDAELGLMGFEVVHADAPRQADPATLSALARELDVAAAVLVNARGRDVDLWIVDRVTGKILVRSVRVDDPDSADAARITAVRSIDLLRASFRELEDEPAPAAAEVPRTAVVLAAMRPRAPRFVLGFGPAVTGAAGGLGPMAHVALAFEAWPHRRFGIGVRTLVPIAGARATATQGSARVLVGWIGVGPRVRLTPPAGVVGFGLGIQAGPAFTGMIGEASPPYRARRDLVTSALLELDAALTIAMHPRLRLWVDAAIGVAIPRVGVRIAGERVATWGLPVGTGVVGLAVAL